MLEIEIGVIVFTAITPILVTGFLISIQSYLARSREKILDKFNDPDIMATINGLNQGVALWHES
jgi:hypothetical protein